MWGTENKKKNRVFSLQYEKDKETDFSCDRMREMFVIRQFDRRKHSHCESLKALADLLIVTDWVETIKRGRGSKGERAPDEKLLHLWLSYARAFHLGIKEQERVVLKHFSLFGQQPASGKHANTVTKCV